MYTILHLPTNTYYGLNKNKHSIAMFKEFHDAKYVAESLATHEWIYGKLPNINSELFMMKPFQKKRKSLDHLLCIKKQPLNMRFIHSIGTRHMDISVIDNIRWTDDHMYDVDVQNIGLKVSMDAYRESLELDSNIIM